MVPLTQTTNRAVFIRRLWRLRGSRCCRMLSLLSESLPSNAMRRGPAAPQATSFLQLVAVFLLNLSVSRMAGNEPLRCAVICAPVLLQPPRQEGSACSSAASAPAQALAIALFCNAVHTLQQPLPDDERRCAQRPSAGELDLGTKASHVKTRVSDPGS